MEVRLFGELEAVASGVPVPVRGAKQRALLALLALQRGQPVSADRLIDVLWGDGQAANPANALQAQIGQLRRTLGPGAAVLPARRGSSPPKPAMPCPRDPARSTSSASSSWSRRDSGWPPTVRWSRRRPFWARPSACGAASRWARFLMPGFLMSHG